MVQLDNGKWYLIKGNMSGLEVVAMPENDVNMPEFPALADVCDDSNICLSGEVLGRCRKGIC